MPDQIIASRNEFHKAVLAGIGMKPTSVRIATYGVWAGVTDNGVMKMNDVGEIFQEAAAHVPDTKVLVGAYSFKSCTGQFKCKHCVENYLRGTVRLLATAEAFPTIAWRCLVGCHLKCVHFQFAESARVIVGGRNFTDSEWLDLSFVFESSKICHSVMAVFDSLWATAMHVDKPGLGKLLDKALPPGSV